MQKKINYFYIDESGGINNDSNFFIHGCIKTDSPHTISLAIKKLIHEMSSSLYYEEFSKRILKEGLHATENNIDMRADVYKLLPLLDYRSYFVIINKHSEYFKELKKNKEEHEIFEISVKKLLKDRIDRNKGDKNIFIFEKIKISKKSLQVLLNDFFSSLDASHDCEFKIVGKEEENMGVIDYLNFIFNHILSEENPMQRMKMNFELIAPKIGVINVLNNNVYLSRKKKLNHQISLENLMREIGGKSG